MPACSIWSWRTRGRRRCWWSSSLWRSAGRLRLRALRAAARGLRGPHAHGSLRARLGWLRRQGGRGAPARLAAQGAPAAPSHASALMSGVMLKVALYGIFRFGFDILAPATVPLPGFLGLDRALAGHRLRRARRAPRACSSTTSSACSRSTVWRTWASSSSARAGDAARPRPRGRAARNAGAGGVAAAHAQPRGIQGAAVSWARAA